MSTLLLKTLKKALSPLGIVVRPRPRFEDELGVLAQTHAAPDRAGAPSSAPVSRVRSFYGNSMDQAMRKALAALGDDAVILKTSTTDPSLRHEGEYEVVCGCALMPDLAEASAAPTPQARPGESPASELADLRRQIRRLREQLDKAGTASSGATVHSRSNDARLEEHLNMLIEAGMSRVTAREVIQGASARAERRRTGAAESDSPPDLAGDLLPAWQMSIQDLQAELLARVLEPKRSVATPADRVGMALVGPPGSGKTTAILKLARRFSLQPHVRIRILALVSPRDTSAFLRESVASMNLPCNICHSVAELGDLLQKLDPSETFMLDTPAFDSSNIDSAAALSQLLSGYPQIQINLVLPAHMEARTLSRMLDYFELLAPSRILLSNMDQAVSLGGPLDVVLRSRKPVSFVGSGRGVTSAIEPAKPSALVRQFLNSLALRPMGGLRR